MTSQIDPRKINNLPFKTVRSSTIDIIRRGRPVRVRVTHALQFDGGGWSFAIKRIRFASRRRYSLTAREIDRAAFRSAAAVA